jgi:hypothetical protein
MSLLLLLQAGSPAAVTGSFSVTESSQDSYSASGLVLVRGILSSVELLDSTSGSGDVIVQGLAASIESASDTLASIGSILVSGVFSATESGLDALSASGGLVAPVVGEMAAHEGALDAIASSGKVIVIGNFSSFEDSDFFNADGVLIGAVVGDFAAIEGADTFTSYGNLKFTIDANYQAAGIDASINPYPISGAYGTIAISPIYNALPIESEYTQWQVN